MPLSVGDTAPNFTVNDTNGNRVSLADYAGKTVVLYFYPKDDTPGCTKEACSFRDHYASYQGKDVTVFGVSMDDESSHQAFTDKFSLPFPLLADTDGTLTKSYDVRKTFWLRLGFDAVQSLSELNRVGRFHQAALGLGRARQPQTRSLFTERKS
jgi:thioredoxin-dependent peroxiredoxin